ncbi:hypothetical protein [Xanthomonas sp. 60]
MPHHETLALAGTIEHVFAHRFTVLSGNTVHLADLGPKGAQAFALEPGLTVRLEGEQRPSEIKVLRIARKGGRFVEVHHAKPHHAPKHAHPDVPADPLVALAAVEKADWKVRGEPRRKPKHFEVLARRGGGGWTELHVDFAGTIYKEKPADPDKWALPG